MGEIRVESERMVGARQVALFMLVADYDARPRYLPPNFEDWRVERGGLGGGTVVSYRLRTGKRERAYRMSVEEETVGSVLVERDAGSSLVTTWTLVEDGPARTRVRIASRWRGAGGVAGLFEAQFAPMGLRRIYDDLLARLDRFAAATIPPPPPEPERLAPQRAPTPIEFPADLREPVGPAARRAQADREARNGGRGPHG